MTRQLGLRFAALLVPLALGGAWLYVRSNAPNEREQADRAIDRRDFAAAREHLDRHLAMHPDDADARFLLARTTRRAGDLDAARKQLDALPKSEAVDFEKELLHLTRGNRHATTALLASCRAVPDDEKSDLALEAVIELTLNSLCDPDGDHVPIPEQDLNETTVPHAREAIALWFEKPRSAADRVQGHVWRARLREIGGDHAGALADLRDALALDPQHLQANYLSARFRRQEAPEESLAILERLQARHPEEPKVLLASAEVLRAAGRLKEARAALDRLLAVQPRNANALILRGLVLLDLQQAIDAEADLRRGLEAAPKEPSAYSAMSRCMRLLNRPDEAEQYQEQFLRLERERQSPK